jgi:hypothetical protein
VDAVWAGIIAGVGSGVPAAALGGFVTLRKVRSDLAAEYDKDLRTRRLENYLEIWPQFASLSLTKTGAIHREELTRFSDALRDWYFAKGGIYLSRGAMDVYNVLQRHIAFITEGENEPSAKDLDVARFFASTLRSRMTEDLGTRRSPLIFRRSALAEARRRRALYRQAGTAINESRRYSDTIAATAPSDNSPRTGS